MGGTEIKGTASFRSRSRVRTRCGPVAGVLERSTRRAGGRGDGVSRGGGGTGLAYGVRVRGSHAGRTKAESEGCQGGDSGERPVSAGRAAGRRGPIAGAGTHRIRCRRSDERDDYITTCRTSDPENGSRPTDSRREAGHVPAEGSVSPRWLAFLGEPFARPRRTASSPVPRPGGAPRCTSTRPSRGRRPGR